MNTPKGFRLHIGLFGRRNVGKSSLLNAVTRQEVSIVSETAGTTTDPVEKPMEFLPLGPVLFIDTAGVDDEGALGELRIAKTRTVFDRTDLAVVVSDGAWGDYEQKLLDEFKSRAVPVLVVFNKFDLRPPDPGLLDRLEESKIPFVSTSAPRGEGLLEFRQALLDNAPADFINSPRIIGDLIEPGDLVILVIPIDKEAPKGRVILPQVQTLRDVLDSHASALVLQETELKEAFKNLPRRPRLVVTDSQAFEKVAADTPPDVWMTGFSVLFSRFKGDLAVQTEGALAIDRLRPGDRVLVAESCSHHPIADDIGREKIPRWLQKKAGGPLRFHTVQGHDFPPDLADYKLVVQCGACMGNRREVLSRIMRCRAAGVPFTNYGLAIAYCLGLFQRALEPFPQALEIYRRAVASGQKVSS